MGIFSYIVLYIMALLSSFVACRFLIMFSSSGNKAHYYIIYMVLNLAIIYLSLSTQANVPEIMNSIIGILFAVMFCRFVLKIDFHTAFLTALLYEAVFGIYNIVAFTFSGIMLRETKVSEYIVLLLSSALILILSTGTFELFIRRYGNHGRWSGKYSILYICPLAFICFVSETIINVAYNPVEIYDDRLRYSTSSIQDIEIFFAVGISLISIYVIMHFYEKVMRQMEIQSKMSALEAYSDMQKQYIKEAKQKYENTKVFRHDMNNHMLTLNGLIKNKETEKAAEYLKRFDREVKALSFEVSTGNAVIDILLKEKLGFASEQGIKVICDMHIPKDFIVDDFDLCIIFFNALDNAIKGCEFAHNKLIDIVAKQNKDFFIIDIMNSFNAEKYQKGSGIGLETVQFITTKYGGYLEVSEEKEIFRVSIMFYVYELKNNVHGASIEFPR